MFIDIFRLTNNQQIKVASIASDDAVLATAIMSKNEISITLVTEDIPAIKEGDFLFINSVKYKLNRDPEFTDKSSVNHETTYLFEAPEYTLIDKILCNKITGSTKVTLTGTLRDFLELLVWNVNLSDDNPLGISEERRVGEEC